MDSRRSVAFAFAFSSCLFAKAAEPDQTVQFNRDIRPILSDKCFFCHGPDSTHREADLRLDQEQAAKANHDGVIAIVPGNPDISEAILRVFHDDPDELMPPPKSKRELSDSEKELLKRWVSQGAPWQEHWAFVPPETPELPPISDPDWIRNGVDRFVLARLDSENLKPSPEASKTTLIRRVTLDLTGVPPTLEEVAQFLADDSDRAYEKVVDRLLKSKRYGETMALPWLDAARYADTDGYQYDGPRDMWRWRDWVIDAYNRNLPFDQFTIEQLAGDLLPHPTREQLIATGFNRNHRYNSEAGLVTEEFLLENAVDRVDTTSTVWLGLTMGCARCHDHKYDPISQKDYYQLIAFFNAVPEAGRAIKAGNSEPYITAPLPEQEVKLAEFDQTIATLEKRLGTPEADRAYREWSKEQAVKQPDFSAPLVAQGQIAYHQFESLNESVEAIKGTPIFSPGITGNAASFDGNCVLSVGNFGNVRADARFSVSFWIRPDEIKEGVVFSRQNGGTTRPGIAVEVDDGKVKFLLISRWIAGAGVVETVETIPVKEWTHVTISNDGSQSANGQKIYLNGKAADVKVVLNTNSNTGGVADKEPFRVGGGVYGKNFVGAVDELRFYDRTLRPEEAFLLSETTSIDTIARFPETKRTARQEEVLKLWFFEHGDPKFAQTFAELESTRLARQKYHDSLPTTMVMVDMPNPPATHLRVRGVYNDFGEKVERGVPTSLPPLPSDFPRNRLGFAKWLVDGNHPLTARVAVNRWWQRYFGLGLVKTSEDFGVQGELPSHPALLDWLATELVRTGWDIAAMQKLIVMSATYRQSSNTTPELRERDPDNRLLARASRMRLPGHVLRDQALFVGGLLAEQIGGPSVYPYQPANLWEEMSMGMKYRDSKGSDLFRRSLYTVWKRTVNPPSMAILDAADREACWVRTKRTNTPLQALTLLNETAFVESARHLATRLIAPEVSDPVQTGFEIVTGRLPSESEKAILAHALEEYRTEFRQSPKNAAKLIAYGTTPFPKGIDSVELAAHTALANVLLNLDEAITRE
ncbi:MAG: DUF1553 domain-containing protein [Verrucomicrobiae bacterium]|nr:DUF1553 domain-containing protein [Verrucomicrobiae bacterium]